MLMLATSITYAYRLTIQLLGGIHAGSDHCCSKTIMPLPAALGEVSALGPMHVTAEAASNICKPKPTILLPSGHQEPD
jgi:hypothetical protein